MQKKDADKGYAEVGTPMQGVKKKDADIGCAEEGCRHRLVRKGRAPPTGLLPPNDLHGQGALSLGVHHTYMCSAFTGNVTTGLLQ